MIEINLLPEEQRVKKTEQSAASQLDNIVFLFPLIVIIVVLVHLYLLIMFFSKTSTYASLEKKWRSMEPQKKEVSGMKSEIDANVADARAVEAFMKDRIELAAKLNKLSVHLPSGIWFNDVSFSRRQFIVRGSVVSLKTDEMDMINTFVQDLKGDKEFSADFVSIELGAVQRKTIGSYDVVDFVLTSALQAKDER